MSTLTIPAQVVPYIRGGAQHDLTRAAEQLATVIGEVMTTGVPPSGERRRLLEAWALLDELGWLDETAGPIELNVCEHRDALIGALAGNTDRLAEMIAESEGDPRRASNERDLHALREFEGTTREALERDRPVRITATMPADVVVELRGALFAELGRACEDAPATVPESKTRAGWIPVLRRLDDALAGLDMIGWAEPGEQQALTITLDAAMIEVLEADAEQWEWLSEQERLESVEGRARAAERAANIERFLASVAERPAPASLTIPALALRLVREGALDALNCVSQTLDEGVDPRECCRRLTAICDLLDLVGWSPEDEPTTDIEAAAHARTVVEVAAQMVPILTTARNDLRAADPSMAAAAEADLRLMCQLHADASGAGGGLERLDA